MIGDLRAAARALGGEVSGQAILCPGPGHSHRDRSLSVLFSPYAPDGFVVRSHAGDDDLAAKDYVRSRLGLPDRDGGRKLPFVENFSQREIHTAPTHDFERSRRAIALFEESEAPLGSPVELHLASRGLAFPDRAADSLRCAKACPFGTASTIAMVALVRNIMTDAPQAVHRTALDGCGRKMALEGKDRLALGPLAGGAVKLTPDEDVATCLGIGEGIESTLSLRCLPEFGASPVWALLSTSGVTAFPVLSGIEVLWIAVDHDPAGERAARACAERWRKAGREVFLVRPKAMKADLNDVVQGGRRHG